MLIAGCGVTSVMSRMSSLQVSDEQRVALERMARSPSQSHRAVVQARALLLAADGVSNPEIAERVDASAPSVRRWRHRFACRGVAGVGKIAPGRGRKPRLPEGTVPEVVRRTQQETPPNGDTHWTSRSLAREMGIGKDAVAKIWADHELKPWQVKTFKVSHDPAFEDKLTDVVGLYMDPPARAAVFSFDEKPQTQALDRTQPSLPLKPGRAATRTHDYKRHGTTDIFAALNLATGHVLTDYRGHHTGADVLAFFQRIDAQVPEHLDVHVVLDNLSAHTAPEVQHWLADPARTRWHLHFTPSASSWTNLVERWFKELTDERLRRGAFASVDELIEAIEDWAAHWNENPRPFVWHKPAEEIIAKARRGRETLNDSDAQFGDTPV
jgi:transposase